MTDHAELRVINSDGQLIGTLADFTQPLEDQISGLQRDIRGWAHRYEELKRDKARSAKHHPLYDDGKIAFGEWRQKCKHPRSQFTADRFWLVAPFLENEKYGLKTVLRAIEGAAYDPWETKRKNGTVKRHDGWELIFRDTGQIEDFANRAPRAQLTIAG